MRDAAKALLAQSSVCASGSAAETANDKRSQVRVTARLARQDPFVAPRHFPFQGNLLFEAPKKTLVLSNKSFLVIFAFRRVILLRSDI